MKHLLAFALMMLLASTAAAQNPNPTPLRPRPGTFVLADNSAALVVGDVANIREIKLHLWVHPSTAMARTAINNCFYEGQTSSQTDYVDQQVSDSVHLVALSVYFYSHTHSIGYRVTWDRVGDLRLVRDSDGETFIFRHRNNEQAYTTAESQFLTRLSERQISLSPEHELVREVDWTPPPRPAKPVIYLHPTTPTDVEVQLTLTPESWQQGIFYPQPDAAGKWHVRAHPDGLLTDTRTGTTYPSLFWEATAPLYPQAHDMQQGWLVQRDSLIPVFERVLNQMAFSPAERAEFIQYWLPILGQHPQVFIHFAFSGHSASTGPFTNPTGTLYDAAAPLRISPAPQEWLRVNMLWHTVTEPMPSPQPQTLPRLSRTGYYGLEWGGTQIHTPLFWVN